MRVTLQDFNDIPSDPAPPHQLQFTPLQTFIDTEETAAEALLGDDTNTLLPNGGTLLMYGDGGAGKTTLSIDGACHLAAGQAWLGNTTSRPCRIAIIENEGPRAKFRQHLRQKAAAWNGQPPFVDNITVLEDPWTRFTLQDEHHRNALAAQITHTELDIVMLGPVATVGMRGGGTPDEINAFEELVANLRAQTRRPFALWLIHHENKAGDVSGAWERVPDTLIHVQAQGNGRTHLVWRKTRWSSFHHGTSVNLLWADNHGFQVETEAVRDIAHELLEHMQPGEWYTAKDVKRLIGIGDAVRPVLERLTSEGQLSFEIGPPGRRPNSHCWAANKPFTSDLDGSGHHRSVTPLWGVGDETDLLTRPIERGSVGRSVSSTPRSDLTSAGSGQVSSDPGWLKALLDSEPPDTD
jgi:hypothetical protein